VARSIALLVVWLVLFGGAANGIVSAGPVEISSETIGAPELPKLAGPTGSDALPDDESRTGPTPNASIVALYPNPSADEDAGEHVVIDVPASTRLSNWTIVDDSDQRVELPDQTVSGRLAVSHEPNRTRNQTEVPVLAVSDSLGLANGGETLELRHDDVLVDTVSYEDAPESERWQRSIDGGQWRPLGATDRDPFTSTGGTATAFVLPDGDDIAVEQLEAADHRLLLGGYSLTADRVVRALVAAHDRGVSVSVLVDESPVGGTSIEQVEALDRLATAGIEVLVLGGESARYSFHHAKYAVVDERALVTTENWKPAGTGGKASRGWGVVVHDPKTADELAALFDADTSWRDAIPWSRYRETVDPVTGSPANDTYRTAFAPKRVPIESAKVLVTPDNAERELLGLLRSAKESIRIQQVSIGGLEQPLLNATLEAARRGVTVEIQLSTAWYVEEENRKLATRLRSIAGSEGLALTVELVDPRSRFEKIHTKGVLVDDRHVVVGSINWNNHSLRENREVAVVLTGEEIAAYYDRVLTADRRGGVWRLPVGLVVLFLLFSTGAAFGLWRRLTWRSTGKL
jgi:phosphatidylserine/phosphatidylglycerophosphate/cardiolipin synthase-like enzyme